MTCMTNMYIRVRYPTDLCTGFGGVLYLFIKTDMVYYLPYIVNEARILYKTSV